MGWLSTSFDVAQIYDGTIWHQGCTKYAVRKAMVLQLGEF